MGEWMLITVSLDGLLQRMYNLIYRFFPVISNFIESFSPQWIGFRYTERVGCYRRSRCGGLTNRSFVLTPCDRFRDFDKLQKGLSFLSLKELG